MKGPLFNLQLNMVLLETLRLYCPVLETLRETSRATKLGDFLIPKGVFITIQLVQLHRSKEYWGEDANDFNPLRFKNGVSQAAKHPNAFLGLEWVRELALVRISRCWR
jgi:cytochrome P450